MPSDTNTSCQSVHITSRTLALLLSLLILMGSLATPASAQATNHDDDIRQLDRLLSRVQPGQTEVAIDDMLFTVAYLKAYRDALAGGSRFAVPAVAKWPGGIVYYRFAPGVPGAKIDLFLKACREWEKYAN